MTSSVNLCTQYPRKRRIVLKNRLRFTLFIIFIVVALCTVAITLISHADVPDIKRTHISIVVNNGDTLWEIASDNRGKMDIRKFIYETKKLNNLKSADIYPGQKLTLPVY